MGPPPLRHTSPSLLLLVVSLGAASVIFDANRALVVAGYNSGDMDNVESLALDEDPRNCQDLPDYPIVVHGTTGSFLDGTVKVCGGLLDSLHISQCFEFNPVDGTWKDGGSMSENRLYAASSVLDGVWFITGGTDEFSKDSTEIWDGNSFRPGPYLPIGMSYHCQVTLNSTHIFFADPEITKNAWMLNWEDFTYKMVDSLSRLFITGPCGMATSESKGQEIVVTADGASEIFSVDTLRWREGPGLPANIDYSSVAQLDDTFYLLGGQDSAGSIPTDIVFKYNQEEEAWEEAGIKLAIPRSQVGSNVVMVPEDFIAC